MSGTVCLAQDSGGGLAGLRRRRLRSQGVAETGAVTAGGEAVEDTAPVGRAGARSRRPGGRRRPAARQMQSGRYVLASQTDIVCCQRLLVVQFD